MASEEPNRLTVLLKFLEVFELTVRNDFKSQDPTNTTNIINSQIQSLIQNVEGIEGRVDMGDHYETGQAGAVGPSSSAQHMSFNQVWNQLGKGTDLGELADELSGLRAAMRGQSTTPEQDVATAEVAQAEIAASNGDGPGVLEHLSRAGNWALSVATGIGAEVAIEAIRGALGI